MGEEITWILDLYFNGMLLGVDPITGIKKDTCLKEIGLHVQYMMISPGSIVNVTEGTYYDHLRSTRIFTLAMIEIFLQVPKTVRKMTMGMIWI